jgi:hypothetical protein
MWLLSFALAGELVIDTASFRFTAATQPPTLATVSDHDRLCTFLVSAEPAGVQRYPIACSAHLQTLASSALKAWSWSVTTPPTSAVEVAKLTLVFPTQADPEGGVLFAWTGPRALRQQVPAEVVLPNCAGEPAPSAESVRAFTTPPAPSELCSLEVTVDWLGRAHLDAMTGCPADLAPLAERWVQSRRTCAETDGGMPTTRASSPEVRVVQLERAFPDAYQAVLDAR